MLRFHGRRFILLVVFFSVSCFPCLLSADASYDVVLFRSPAAGSPYLGLFGSRVLAHKQPSVGLDLQYDYKSLNYVNAAGSKSDVISQTFLFQPSVALGLWNWFDFGVSIPAGYVGITPVGQTKRQSRFRAGDTNLELHFTAIDPDRYRIGLAFVPFATFPTGSTSSYLGRGSVTGGALAVVESDFWERKVGLLLNLGYRYQKSAVKDNSDIGGQFLYGLGVRCRILPSLNFIAEVEGRTLASNMFKKTQESPTIVLGGFSYRPEAKDSPARGYAGGGAGVVSGLGSPKAMAVLGGRYFGPQGVYVSKKAAEPAQETKKTEVPFEPAALGHPLLFANASALVAVPYVRELMEVADYLALHPEIQKIRIEGHANNVGSEEYNYRLSLKRAVAVEQLLINLGVDPARLEVAGLGFRYPAVSAKTRQAEELNRRVELKILVP